MNMPLNVPNALAEQLTARIRQRTACVAVLGLGYVGLPLAEAFALRGFPVLGFDTDTGKVAQLNRGQSYLGHISPERTTRLVSETAFEATTDVARLAEADALVICVPTPLTEAREPDLSCVVKAGEVIRRSLRPGQVVILESTTYPGTTEEVLRPLLERTGLRAGQDFFLAFSPEREDPGNPVYQTRNIPKVVGGINDLSRDLAASLYEAVVERVVPVSDTRVAEACKILENTYRAVNIGLINELKVVFAGMGLDVWEVIEAAKTKPFGFQAFYPGPGLGGHCIPIDPFYLTWAARRHGLATRFIELAGEVNASMPQYVVQQVAEALNEQGKPIRGSRICLLGVAYKPDVGDVRESPALVILEELRRLGAWVSYNDPHIPSVEGLESQPLSEEFLAGQDCVIVVTNHSAYDWDWVVRHASLVVDTRNATGGCAVEVGRVWKA